MAIFNDAVPAGSEALKLGAQRIREMKTSLNTMLGTLFNDDLSPKDSSITEDDLAAGAVTNTKIADGAVSTAKIADGAVTEAKLAAAVLHAWTDQTAGPLVIDQVYKIRTINGSDSFTDVGASDNNIGTEFTATGATPAVWSSGSTVSLKDTTGLAKMQDKFVQTAKLEDLSVTEAKLAVNAITTSKIADGSITAAKLDVASGVASAIVRWSGSGYFLRTVSKTTDPTNDRLTLTTTLPTDYPVNGAGVTSDNAPTGIIVYNVTADDSAHAENPAVHFGRLYYIYVHGGGTGGGSTPSISLHTSVQGAIDGTTDIVDIAANYNGVTHPSTYYFKAINPSAIRKRGCDIIPVVSPSSFDRLRGWRVIWRTPWADALSGYLQFTENFPAVANSNGVSAPTVVTADYTEVYYISGNDWWNNANTEFSTAAIQAFTGYLYLIAFQ